MMQTSLNLPFPPSTNGLYVNWSVKGQKGRKKSPAYQKWLKAAGDYMKLQRKGHHAGNVSVNIMVNRPDNRRHDLDNLAKAPLDLLVSYGIIKDDSNIQQLTIAWTQLMGRDAYVIIKDYTADFNPVIGGVE